MTKRMMPAVLTAAGLLLAGGLPALAAEKVTLEGRFGEVKSEQSVKSGIPDGPELSQKVRVDKLKSRDPAFDGSTFTLYEHGESFPSYGNYKIYGVLATPAGDQAYMTFDGKWDVVMQDGKFVEAPFAADGKLLGGTGKLASLKGDVHHKGKVSAAEGGSYSLELDPR